MTRPFVYANMATTVDGKITSAAREYPTFTSDIDRRHMDRLRAQADALVLGAGTLRADDPPLHVRDPEMQALRASLGKPRGLLQVLVSASCEVDPSARFFTGPQAEGRIVATTQRAAAAAREKLPDSCEVWALGESSVDLPRLLQRLHARGVARLLLEGGGELNWAFAGQGLLDELHVTVAPALLGGRQAPTLLEGTGFSMSQRARLRLTDVRREGDELFCRYTVVQHEPFG